MKNLKQLLVKKKITEDIKMVKIDDEKDELKENNKIQRKQWTLAELKIYIFF